MKLILKMDDNTEVEVKEIQSIDKECKTIILFLDTRLGEDDIESIQEQISEFLGKKVLILDKVFNPRIYSVA